MFWTHDGPRRARHKIGRGNRWVVAGIVVRLPFTTAAVCLPVLFRLWAGKGTDSPVTLGAVLLQQIRDAFPDRVVHGVGDAAYHGKPLLVDDTTWTTRVPANATLYAPAPPPTGRRGRPRLKGAKLPKLKDIAATTTWVRTQVYRYGRTEIVDITVIPAIWYGPFANTAGQVVLVKTPTRPARTTWPCSPPTAPPPARRSSSGTRCVGPSKTATSGAGQVVIGFHGVSPGVGGVGGVQRWRV